VGWYSGYFIALVSGAATSLDTQTSFGLSQGLLLFSLVRTIWYGQGSIRVQACALNRKTAISVLVKNECIKDITAQIYPSFTINFIPADKN
jgi:hypothetical protein